MEHEEAGAVDGPILLCPLREQPVVVHALLHEGCMTHRCRAHICRVFVYHTITNTIITVTVRDRCKDIIVLIVNLADSLPAIPCTLGIFGPGRCLSMHDRCQQLSSSLLAHVAFVESKSQQASKSLSI